LAISLIERYRARLPVSETTPVVSLGEGSTPLIRAPRLSQRYGADVWLKWDAANPTGSYKDRGMTVAVSKAVEEGARAVVVASTGNTASSAAAYAAKAGIGALILQPLGAVASGKVAQTRMYGATVLDVRGSFDEALAAARILAARGTYALVNSVNPYRREGQKTAVFEIVEELGMTPDAIYLPYGGGGNTTAYGQAFAELGGMPSRLIAAEARDRPHTVASAIRIAEPAHAETVAEAIRLTEGAVVTLADDVVLASWTDLARSEGLFCEPSSAAGLAALDVERPEPGSTVVCVITGHGLKDPATAAAHAPAPVEVDPDPDAITALLLRKSTKNSSPSDGLSEGEST
jgi:threonine synthase